MSERREIIISLLESTKRENMLPLIEYMIDGGFFTQPSSTKFHNSFEEGLAMHSLGVFCLLEKYSKEVTFNPGPGAITLPVARENLIIAALLHDICKMGAYLGNAAPYKWNRAQPKGHALLSLLRIAKYIKMEPIEEMMIKFHMGTYGTLEFGSYASEYPIRGDKAKSKEERYGLSLANAWYHNPIVKLMYLCDELEMLT